MAAQSTLPPVARTIFGLLCVASGTMPVLAAFDVGPLDRGDINGPPWLGVAAGGVFILGGVVLMLGKRLRTSALSSVFGVLIFGAFAAIGNWIAFGAGPRVCTVAIVGFAFESDSLANEISCRIGFGIGAAILDGVLIVMAAGALKKLAGPGFLPTWIERAGWAVLLLGLSPIMVPVFAIIIGKGLIESFAIYRATGAWPRNEAFIARMRKRRASES